MIAGVATETMVESTRIMKKPRQSANSAGHGSFSAGVVVASGVPEEAGAVVTGTPNTGPWTMHSMSTHQDLMAGPPPTHLPEDPATVELAGGAAPVDAVRHHPASPVA